MATVSKQFLSGSVNGRAIVIASSSSLNPTPIHTAPAGTTSSDEIWLYLTNFGANSLTASISWGVSGSIQDTATVIVNPYNGRTLIADGRLINNGLTVYAYATPLVNSSSIDGFVNRITS